MKKIWKADLIATESPWPVTGTPKPHSGFAHHHQAANWGIKACLGRESCCQSPLATQGPQPPAQQHCHSLTACCPLLRAATHTFTQKTDCRQHILGLILTADRRPCYQASPTLRSAPRSSGQRISFSCTAPFCFSIQGAQKTSLQIIRRKTHQSSLPRGLIFGWFVVLLIK